MDKECCQAAFEDGYNKGREDASHAVRSACLVLGGQASLNIHFITAAAEG